jgi:hypothetical protein
LLVEPMKRLKQNMADEKAFVARNLIKRYLRRA